MKERPILFSGEMVRAILDGRKTQTRRIVKPCLWTACEASAQANRGRVALTMLDYDFPMPYGEPRDRLWVKETFRLSTTDDWCEHDYACSCKNAIGQPIYHASYGDGADNYKWKPSIHMARRYSRITLEITDIRVERLNDISEEDAKAEGVNGTDPKSAFGLLWSTINGYNSWTSNPWVWVVTFKRIKP